MPQGSQPAGEAEEPHVLSADNPSVLGKLLSCSGHTSAESTWSCFPCKPVNFFDFIFPHLRPVGGTYFHELTETSKEKVILLREGITRVMIVEKSLFPQV